MCLLPMQLQGILSINFVLENLFVYEQKAVLVELPWRSMANEMVSGSFDLRLSRLRRDSRGAQEDKRDNVFSQAETLQIQVAYVQ